MRSLMGLLVTTLMLSSLSYFTWIHLRHSADPVEFRADPILEQARKTGAETLTEGQGAQQPVVLVGPLAKFMNEKSSEADKIETVTYKPTASDYVGGSVVGTSNKVLHQAFAVAGTVDVPFEVPAHAYHPQLHGSFQSYIQAGGAPTTAPGDVEFSLLNQEQYSDMVAGHAGDAVFSADATHNQEVNANLPPTMGKPAQYHMIFRNVSPKTGKRVVQADFQMDF